MLQHGPSLSLYILEFLQAPARNDTSPCRILRFFSSGLVDHSWGRTNSLLIFFLMASKTRGIRQDITHFPSPLPRGLRNGPGGLLRRRREDAQLDERDMATAGLPPEGVHYNWFNTHGVIPWSDRQSRSWICILYIYTRLMGLP